RRAHQSYHATQPGLMNPYTTKVTLHYDHSLTARSGRAMKIEQLQALPKANREFVLRKRSIQRAPHIGDQFAADIVDGDHNPPAHQSRSGVKTYSKLNGSGALDSALRQIRMTMIHTRQSETQRSVVPFFFPNQLHSP